MALTDENGSGMVMPVAPMYGGGNGGFGGFGGDSWGWIILLLLFAGGGWGMGGYGMGGYGNMMLGYDFPWLLNGQQNIMSNTNNGFRDSMLNDGITSIRDGINALSTQLCGCCGDMQMAIAQGFAGVEQGANARQMANMQQAFNSQIATMQGFNGVQSQNADIKATILQENCQDRYEAANNARDIIANATANTQALLNSNQRIMDKLCDQELQAERRENQNLRSELMYARGQASQIDQTAQIKAGQNATMTALVNELRSCPIPSQPVYGNQPIFTCSGPVWNNNGCGCGCGCGNAFA